MSAHRRARTTPSSTAIRLAVASAAMVGATAIASPIAGATPVPKVGADLTIDAPARTQISFQHSPTGIHAGTRNEHESRPGLSIVKMYIADYVFANGNQPEQDAAYDMLRTSNDATASSLYATYPQSINDTAHAYGLTETFGAAHWGNSQTSSYDSMQFLEAKKRQNPNDPVLRALAESTPVAADGYRQDFGTSQLPGVKGTKFGWSDDGASFHATASYGDDFSVTAATNGTADQLTNDVLGAFLPGVSIPAPPQLPNLQSSY